MGRKSHKKGSTDQQQTKAIKKLDKKVKALEKPIERKFYDLEFDTVTPAPVAGTIQALTLNNVPPVAYDGTITSNIKSQNCRMGMSISMTRLRIKGELRLPIDIDPNLQKARVRLIVVRVKQSQSYSAVTPGFSNFIKSAKYLGTTPDGDAEIDGFKNPYPKRKYEILYDRVYKLDGVCKTVPAAVGPTVNSGTRTDPWRHALNINIKLNSDAKWGDPTSVSGPSLNGLQMYWVANIKGPLLRCNVRLNYLDN